jgi:hypothetical protein
VRERVGAVAGRDRAGERVAAGGTVRATSDVPVRWIAWISPGCISAVLVRNEQDARIRVLAGEIDVVVIGKRLAFGVFAVVWPCGSPSYCRSTPVLATSGEKTVLSVFCPLDS